MSTVLIAITDKRLGNISVELSDPEPVLEMTHDHAFTRPPKRGDLDSLIAKTVEKIREAYGLPGGRHYEFRKTGTDA